MSNKYEVLIDDGTSQFVSADGYVYTDNGRMVDFIVMNNRRQMEIVDSFSIYHIVKIKCTNGD